MQSEYILGEIDAERDNTHGLPLSSDWFCVETQSWQLPLLAASAALSGRGSPFHSLVLGGVPYLIFVAGVLLWSKGRSDSAIRKLSFIAPPLFVLVTAALSPVALLFGASPHEVPAFIAVFAFYALIFGYLYVFIVNSLYEVFLAKRPET